MGKRVKQKSRSASPSDEAPRFAFARGLAWLAAHPPVAIFLLALLVRVAAVVFLFNGDNPLYDPTQFPDGDLYENLAQAREIVERGGLPESHFIHGPLYIYIVAATLKLSGDAFVVVYVLQMLLGAGAAALVYRMGEMAFGAKAALAAGLLAALHAPNIYYETILTSDSMIAFFVALLLYFGMLYGQGTEWRWWPMPIAMGVVLGALTLLRANLCLLGLGLALWLLIGRSVERPFTRRLAATTVIAAVSILMILPACLWNTRKAGAPRFVVGESATIWKFSWSEDSPGYFKYPEPDSRILSPLSPRAWKLAATKVAQYFVWFEFPDLTNFHLYRKLSPPLRYNPMTFRILGPLALLGLLIAADRFRRLGLLYACLLAILIAAVMFYNSGRYRLASLPLLFVFAGHALESLWASIGLRERRVWPLRRFAFIAPALALLVAAVNLYDPSRLHSMWHSDIIFSNHNVSLAAKQMNEGDLRRAELYAGRLLWVSYIQSRIAGHGILATIAERRGDRIGARLHLRLGEELADRKAKLPVLDRFGNTHFPPST